MFCLILVHASFRNISVPFRNRLSSKRNKSCIALSCLIPDYLPHFGTDLLKIRPIARWYSPVEAHQRCIYTAASTPPIAKLLFCLIPVHVLFRNIFAPFRNRSSSKRNKSCIALSCFIPDYLPHSGTDFSKIRPIAKWYSLVKAH